MPGGLQLDRWLGGAPDLEGKGSVPNITPSGENIASWSAKNIAYYLERPLRWDPDKEEFPGDDEANRFLDRARREPWVL